MNDEVTRFVIVLVAFVSFYSTGFVAGRYGSANRKQSGGR